MILYDHIYPCPSGLLYWSWGKLWNYRSMIEVTLKDMGNFSVYLTTTNHSNVWMICMMQDVLYMYSRNMYYTIAPVPMLH